MIFRYLRANPRLSNYRIAPYKTESSKMSTQIAIKAKDNEIINGSTWLIDKLTKALV